MRAHQAPRTEVAQRQCREIEMKDVGKDHGPGTSDKAERSR